MTTFMDKLNNLATEVRASYYREFSDEVVSDLLDELSYSHDHNAVLLVGEQGQQRIQDFEMFENTNATGDYLGTFYAYPVIRHHSYPANCFIVAVYGTNDKLIRSRTYYFEG